MEKDDEPKAREQFEGFIPGPPVSEEWHDPLEFHVPCGIWKKRVERVEIREYVRKVEVISSEERKNLIVPPLAEEKPSQHGKPRRWATVGLMAACIGLIPLLAVQLEWIELPSWLVTTAAAAGLGEFFREISIAIKLHFKPLT